MKQFNAKKEEGSTSNVADKKMRGWESSETVFFESSLKKYLEKITKERENQNQKWGEQNHHPLQWLSIIGEEYGEMCKKANEFGFNSDPQQLINLKKEAIQCAACCLAMIESIDRNQVNKTGVVMYQESAGKESVANSQDLKNQADDSIYLFDELVKLEKENPSEYQKLCAELGII